MDKDEFLKELQSYLSVLEEGEQADILEEYAQHIDMKISAGLSEAEAVRYFGNVRELAARILEAYHVNPGYWDLGADGGMTASEPEKSSVFNEIADTLEETAGQIADYTVDTGRAIKNMGKQILVAAGEIMEVIGEVLGAPFRWLGDWITGEKAGGDIRDGELLQQGTGDAGPETDRTGFVRGSSLGNIFGEIGFVFSQFFFWCVRWCRNIVVIAAALCGGICGLLLFFLLAMLLVLLLQGYPLAGVAVACFGGVLCAGTFTFFCTTLLVHKRV
nr:DUF1700 domain-containing protein [uncultured Eisenbergiella sp.]